MATAPIRDGLRFLWREWVRGMLWEVALEPAWEQIEPHIVYLGGSLSILPAWLAVVALGFSLWLQVPIVLMVSVMVTAWLYKKREQRREQKYLQSTEGMIAEFRTRSEERNRKQIEAIRKEFASTLQSIEEQAVQQILAGASEDAAQYLAYVANMNPEERALMERQRRENVKEKLREMDPSGVLTRLLEEREAQEAREREQGQ